MHLLVDALSVNNISGRNVLCGHVSQIAARLRGRVRLTALVSRDNAAIRAYLPPEVAIHEAPIGSNWLLRSGWLMSRGNSLSRRLAVDAIFSPSGMLTAGIDKPQVVLAQNPFPLIDGRARGMFRAKTEIQRNAFAKAQGKATVMAFNSRYMQELYARTLGRRESNSIIAYQGIDEQMFALGERVLGGKRRHSVLCVSVMARHKAVEVLVDAMSRLPGAELVLAGSWPDASYLREIEVQVATLGIGARVRILGHVDDASLHRLYSEARAFCLLSRCESFGIPAVEAQAFGIPVVVAEGTAAPEICGEGGISVAPEDPAGAADALARLLDDDAAWSAMSLSARRNAERFHWHLCSTPLVEAVESLAAANV